MANIVRVRVEIDPDDKTASQPGLTPAFWKLKKAFHKARQDAGIEHLYKQHEVFESKSRKARRKKRESEIARLKNKWRENFS